MGAGERRTKDAAMAADLVRRGIYHGKRQTSSLAPPVPPQGEAGSAAYRRLQNKKKGGTTN